ncbi:MAG: hypothetical protein KAJ51_01945, partial [Thermoplasmata archaeon]|nr:hypothetical protein [Thermoplasmata archaeon]
PIFQYSITLNPHTPDIEYNKSYIVQSLKIERRATVINTIKVKNKNYNNIYYQEQLLITRFSKLVKYIIIDIYYNYIKEYLSAQKNVPQI